MKMILAVTLAITLCGMVKAASVQVMSPNGGENWRLNNMKTISWNASGTFLSFRILLYKDGKWLGVIANNLGPNSTTYQWTVGKYSGGTAATGGGYEIGVRGILGNTTVLDKSDAAFTIDKQQNLGFRPGSGSKGNKRITVKVTSPKKNSNWQTGKYLPIRWQTGYKGPLHVKLYNYSGKRFIRNIKLNVTNGFQWKIPNYVYKWPGKYKVRVSTPSGNIGGFSDTFRISIKTASKSYTIKGETVNRHRYKRKVHDKQWATGCQIDADPGAGKMRVGWRFNKGEFEDCRMKYRSFVYFDLSAFKGKGLLQKAKLRFDKLMGKNCKYKVKVLTKKWHQNTSLWATKGSYHDNTGDFRTVVQKWLAYPNFNFGLVVLNPDDQKSNFGYCVTYYQNVRLELTFLEQAK
jgi:hypothetical protein